MTTTDEIERKFLVSRFEPEFDWPVPYADSHIVQIYLDSGKPRLTERVRRRRYADEGREELTHNLKVPVGPGHYKETEREITPEEFFELRKRADPHRRPIQKTRKVFEWDGWTWELDVFQTPAGLVVMEVELPALDTPIEFPPFVHIEREITAEKGWSNYAMAQKGWVGGAVAED